MTLLIFDCDGVLVDSEVIAHQTLLDAIAPLGLTIPLEDSFALFSGRSLKDTLAIIEQQLGRPLPADFLDQSRRLLFERFRRSLKPVAGVIEAIAALPDARCVASSSSFDRLRLALDVTGLAPLFGADVFSATQVPLGKPAPDLFLFAAKQMDAKPAHCIVIEDSTLGVEAGRAAGMQVIGFAGASHATDALADKLSAGADRVIRTMRDLPRCVEALKVPE
jgi:HAD superfamily hydrolase (TIGR01509 family)